MGGRSSTSGNPAARILTCLAHGRLPPPGFFPPRLLDAAASVSHARGRFTPLSAIERLITTLRHREPDVVPCSPLVISGARRLTGATLAEFATNPRTAADALVAAFDLIGGEVVIPMLDLSVEAADFGQKLVYPQESTPHPDYGDPLIRDHSGYRKLERIEIREARRMQAVLEICRLLVERIGWRGVVSGFCFGPLGVLCMMRGAEHLFRDCVLYTNDVKAALETITEVLAEYVDALCGTGVLAVTLDTLFASHNGLSRELWEDIEGPFVREVSKAIHARGCLVGVHNCGDGIYFDSQIRFMEPEIISYAHLPEDCRDNRELKRRYGGQVVLMGSVDTALLARGTPYEVMEQCRRLMDDLADGGGFILAPGCEYPPNIPLENAWAMVRAARTYGRK
jgi:uroporphyrinogen decarboxylase